jgi:hypothetical protein
MTKKKAVGTVIGAVLIIVVAIAAWTVFFWDINRFKPTVRTRMADALGREVALNGDLEVDWALPPALAANHITLANADWGGKPQMAVVNRIEVIPDWSAVFTGRPRVDRITIRGADIVLEQNAEGSWNLPKPERNGSANTRQTGPPPLTALSLVDSLLLLRTSEKEYRFEIEYVDLIADATGQSTRGSMRFRHKGVPGTLEVTLSPTAALFENQKNIEIDALLQSGRNSLSAKGTVALSPKHPQVDIRFEADGRSPLTLVNLELLPEAVSEPFHLSGRLHSVSGQASYRMSDFSFQSGPDRAEGWFEVAPLKRPLDLTAKLSLRHLDLRPYWPQDETPEKPAAEANVRQNGRVFSSEPFDWSWLEKIDAEIDLDATVLKLPRFALENLTAGVKLQEGRLDLAPVSASIGGGEFEAELHLASGSRNQIQARVKVHRLDLGQMLRNLDLPESIRGEAGFKIDISGSGPTPARLAASLDGSVSLAMQDGQLASRYLEKSELYGFELTDTFLGLFDLEEEEQGEYVKINCVICRFEIEDGVARSDVLVFDTTQVGMVGSGKVDLRNEELDIALKPVTGGGIGLPGFAKLKLGMAPLADAFKLNGTLQHPEISLDKSESALTLGKAIGGMVLFGPVGLTAALLETEFGENNPCVKALEQAGAIPDKRVGGQNAAEGRN